MADSITLDQFNRLTRRIPVPIEEDFGDADFMLADDLKDQADELIKLHTGFSHLADLTINYLWKKKGGKKSGAAVYGKCVKPSGLLSVYSAADFVIWLAADYVRDAEFTTRQIEALLFHEMCHAGVGDDGDKPVLIAHDVEMFRSEIVSYGFWSDELKSLEMSVRQLDLFASEGER